MELYILVNTAADFKIETNHFKKVVSACGIAICFLCAACVSDSIAKAPADYVHVAQRL